MKKAIAAIITDTHQKEENIEVNKSIYRQAAKIVKDLGLNQLEHGGDIFNSRKAQTQVTLDALDTIFDELQAEGITLNVVVGNHDKTDYSSHVSFVKQFRHHPAVNIYSQHGGRPLTKDISISYLSFFEDERYVREYCDLVENGSFSKKNVLLTHIGISGSVMNNGTVISSESITPSLFKKFDLVLVGHFHDCQELADGRIKYIGSSIQHNYGELTGKGLTVLYNDLTTEIIPLKYPQYIKYEVSPKEITKADIEELAKEKNESGDNIRIILTGSDAEIKSFNKQILTDAGLSVKHKTEDLVKEELEQRVEAFDMLSLEENFKKFCQDKKLNYDEGLKYFNKILTTSHAAN